MPQPEKRFKVGACFASEINTKDGKVVVKNVRVQRSYRMERKEAKRHGLKMLEPMLKTLDTRITVAEPVRKPRKGEKSERG